MSRETRFDQRQAAVLLLAALLADSFLLIVLSVLIYFLFSTPVSHLVDTWVVTLRDNITYLDYGKTRLGGSLGYGLMAALAGWLMSLFGDYLVLYLCAMVTMALVMVFMIPIPDIPCKNAGKRNGRREKEGSLPFWQALRVLLSNRVYLLFLLSSLGFYIALRPFSMNVSYKVMELGGGDNELGIALAVAAIAECPLFFVVTRFTRRYKLTLLYLVCVISIIIRGLLFGLAPNFPIFNIGQALHAISNGLYIVVYLEITRAIVPEQVRATGITLMVGISAGVGGIIGTICSGALIDAVGVAWMSIIMVAVVVVSALIYLLPMLALYRRAPDQLV